NSGNILTATWSNITFGRCPQTVEFALRPDHLNKNSHGKWVTGFIEPVPPATIQDIDLSSIRLNGTVGIAPDAPTAVGDFDSDGIPDLMVKFSRFDLINALGNSGQVILSGQIGCECFEGGTQITALALAALPAPVAGSLLQSGTQAQVTWTPD